jgi:hypothetical protein
MGSHSFRVSAAWSSRSRRGCARCSTANRIPTLRLYWCRSCAAASYRPLESGTTCERCEERISVAGSTSFSEDSPARISALRAWEASEVDYSTRSLGLFAKFDRRSCSWKTSQLSLVEDWTESPRKFPRFATIVDGECYQLTTWARRTYARDGSSSLTPTATATDAKSSRNRTVTNRRVSGHSGTTLTDWVTLYPTPSAAAYGNNRGGGMGRVGPVRHSLESMAKHGLWPTPRASANEDRQRKPSPSQLAGKHGWNLQSLAVAVGHIRTAAGKVGGSLNPTWVEWLMGFPLGWTVLDASAMRVCLFRRERRS